MSTEGTWKTKSKFNDSLTVQSNCFFVDPFAAEIRTKFENRKLKSREVNRCVVYATICLSSHDGICDRTKRDDFGFILLKINECKFRPDEAEGGRRTSRAWSKREHSKISKGM